MLTSIGIYPLGYKRHSANLDYHNNRFDEEPLTCETTTLRIIRPYSRFRIWLYTELLGSSGSWHSNHCLLPSSIWGYGRHVKVDIQELLQIKKRVIIFVNNCIRLNLTWVGFYHIVWETASPNIANKLKKHLSKGKEVWQTNRLQRNQGIYKALDDSRHVNQNNGNMIIIIPYINCDVKWVDWCKSDCHSTIIVVSKTLPRRSSLRPWRR